MQPALDSIFPHTMMTPNKHNSGKHEHTAVDTSQVEYSNPSIDTGPADRYLDRLKAETQERILKEVPHAISQR